MTFRILSGNGALQIMPFRKLGGKCHFFLRFCTRKRSKTYILHGSSLVAWNERMHRVCTFMLRLDYIVLSWMLLLLCFLTTLMWNQIFTCINFEKSVSIALQRQSCQGRFRRHSCSVHIPLSFCCNWRTNRWISGCRIVHIEWNFVLSWSRFYCLVDVPLSVHHCSWTSRSSLHMCTAWFPVQMHQRRLTLGILVDILSSSFEVLFHGYIDSKVPNHLTQPSVWYILVSSKVATLKI